jgi:uncharacterized membrane protein YobD (UPF0266 family)
LKTYNRYVLYLTIAAGLVNTLLAFGGQESLEVYFIVNTIVFLGITLLYVRLNPRARVAVDVVGCVLFSGVIVILIVKTIHNLSGV